MLKKKKKNDTENTMKFTLSYYSQNFEELLLLKYWKRLRALYAVKRGS